MVSGAGGVRRGREEQVEDAFFGGLLGAIGDFVEFFFADHVDGCFDEIANHGFDVAADVADFGVLRGLHFHEGATGETREAAGDFGFADASGADHQNIFRQNVFGDLGRKLLASHAIAKSDGDGALGGVLADDVLVELRDDFAWSHVVERGEQFLLFRWSGAVRAGGEKHFFVGFRRHSILLYDCSFVLIALIRCHVLLVHAV